MNISVVEVVIAEVVKAVVLVLLVVVVDPFLIFLLRYSYSLWMY